MKISLDAFRESLQNVREHPSGQKILLLFGGALLLWGIGLFYLRPLYNEEAQRVALLRERSAILAQVLRQYQSLGGESRAENPGSSDEEPLEALNRVLESLNLQNAISQLTASEKRISFALEGLRGEGLLTLLQELRGAGLFVDSAEIRTLGEGEEKTYALLVAVRSGGSL
ncbi:MAG TPA: type II secretion system protein GspM [Synergistaceae bacterium]|nr:type II secretion system protein GspM [Synergistaceae bacterium]HPQ37226.1 type II secretion system protein GspM [Synergistaceae bacterium]